MIGNESLTQRRNTMPKIHNRVDPRNAKHTVSTNHHNKKHSTIHVHKGGKGKAHSKKTILK